MGSRLKRDLKDQTTRRYVRVVAFVVLGIAVGALIVFLAEFKPSFIETYKAKEQTEEIPQAIDQKDPSPYTRSAPTLLRIPKIGLETEFEAPLELNEDRTIEVPDSYEMVGWYKLGASPGEIGPAVILGHVDSYEGPAVFYSLGMLEEGDDVYVKRADGTEVAFKVSYLERYAQDEFPTEKVYGPTDGSELRLITCTGTYDHGERRYSHNLVVYAVLEEEKSVERSIQ